MKNLIAIILIMLTGIANASESLTEGEFILIQETLTNCIPDKALKSEVPNVTYTIEFNTDGSVLTIDQMGIFDYGIENYYEIVSIITESIIDCKIVANPTKYEAWKLIKLTIDMTGFK